MGLIFTPLSTVALTEIRKEKMAQASGLFNVIRQIGGSFGVAVIGTVLTERTLYHTAIDGQAMNRYSPIFQHVIVGLKYFSTQVLSAPLSMETQRANALVLSNVVQQAIVQATDDAFLFAFAVMILCVVPILFLRTHRRKKVVTMKVAPVH